MLSFGAVSYAEQSGSKSVGQFVSEVIFFLNFPLNCIALYMCLNSFRIWEVNVK